MTDALAAACLLQAVALLALAGLTLWLAPRVWRCQVARQAALEERLRRLLKADRQRRTQVDKLDEFCANLGAILEQNGLRLKEAEE